MKTLNKAILILLFCAPKINIIEIEGFSAGIRVDDIVIAFYAGILIYHRILRSSFVIVEVERRFSIFVGVCAVGVIFNQLFFGRGNILFPIRMLEYFTFFYMGWQFVRDDRELRQLINCIFWVNVAVGAAQLCKLVGGFSVYGYMADVSDRVIGVTAGPWELGVVMNLATGFYLLNTKNSMWRLVLFSIATAVVVATSSRSAFLVQIFLIGYFIYVSGEFRGRMLRLILGLPIVLLLLILAQNTDVSSRSENIININNWTLFSGTYKNTLVSETPPNFKDIDSLGDSNGIDASWNIRGAKWVYAIKMWQLNLGNTLYGVGMGVFGNALDGGWIRLLTETGLLGLGAFLLFINTARKINSECSMLLSAIVINMIFIDIHLSYKAMSITLFVLGYYSRRKYFDFRAHGRGLSVIV